MRKIYEQNRKFCVVKVETMQRTSERRNEVWNVTVKSYLKSTVNFFTSPKYNKSNEARK